MGWGVEVISAPAPVVPPRPYANALTVDGWTCYDAWVAPEDEMGNTWMFQELTGWFGGLDVRGDPVDRPMLDGAFDGDAPFAGRTIEVTGTLIAKNRSALQLGMDRLAGVLAGRTRRGLLVVDEAVVPVTRQALVRLGGPTMITRTSRLTAAFSINLYSPDPLRYTTTETTVIMNRYAAAAGRTYPLVFDRTYPAGGNTGYRDIVTYGNAATSPVIVFNGPSVNPQITRVGGNTLKLLMSIGTGQSVIIDNAARTVLFDGASRRQYLTAASRWIVLPPGNQSLVYTNDSGSGTASVTWRDAWT